MTTRKASPPVYVDGTVRYDLPASMMREIGRIIVRWAHFEYLVQRVNWDVLRLSEEEGRIAVRDPRAEDRLTMLRDLVELNGRYWDDDLYKSIISRTRVIVSTRHLLSHGIWSADQHGNWSVINFKGTWPDDLAAYMPLNKRVSPEGFPMSLADLKATTSEIEVLIADFRRLLVSTTSQPPSPDTHPSRSSRKAPIRGQDEGKPARQPKSSAASRRKAALAR